MSDSDKDTSAAIDKVVGAFRAQREQGKAVAPEADAEPKREPTPVTRLDDPDPTPQGGGGSEAPTKAFKVPAAVAAAAAEATGADDASTELREEHVVGDAIAADPSDVPDAAESPATEKADLVEHAIELPETESDEPAVDATPTEVISADEIAAATADAEEKADAEESGDSAATPPADNTPTTQMAVPAAAVAAAAAGTAAAGTAAATKTETVAKPDPQVVAPTQPAEKKRSGKLIAVVLAVVVVIAVVAIGLWYLLVGQSEQSKVADVAEDYQSAMADGDLDDLRNLTCGAKNDYYSSISPEEFQKAYNAQKARDELMLFDDIQAVQIDGDVARVGVDMYPSSNPAKTVPAQITLHKIDGGWKVCTEP